MKIREACINSLGGKIQPVEVIKYTNRNDVIVRTQNGIMCTAIDNPFTDLLYADDKYGIIRSSL